jgi:hypothetical protein
MWQFYIEFKETPGWWNNNGKKEFTVKDFMVVMFSVELGSNSMGSLDELLEEDMLAGNHYNEDGLKMISHATAHGIAMQTVHATGGKHNGITDNAILNYLGGSQSLQSRYNQHYTNGKSLDELTQSANVSVANRIVSYALDPSHSEWFNGGTSINPVPGSHPGYWGNQSMHPNDPYLWIYGINSKNPFIVIAIQYGR